MKKIGILLTNTGTPDEPTPKAVRRYLQEFLSDKRIVQLPRIIWLPILYALVLTTRPKRSAKLYQKIWLPEGSPMRVTMLKMRTLLQEKLQANVNDIQVEIGMNYGNPSIKEGIKKLKDKQVDEIIVLPLFPQFSHTSTSSSFDRVKRTLPTLTPRVINNSIGINKSEDNEPTEAQADCFSHSDRAAHECAARPQDAASSESEKQSACDSSQSPSSSKIDSQSPSSSKIDSQSPSSSKIDSLTLTLITNYATTQSYITALATSVQQSWQSHPRSQHLLISFHGIPKRLVQSGDPYETHCQATATLLANALNLTPCEWTLCYQSQFGYDKWLTPSTQAILSELPSQGIKTLDIVCPGFSIDCLETLEEIAIGGKEIFLQAGGESLHCIPALNDSNEQIEMLVNILSPLTHHDKIKPL